MNLYRIGYRAELKLMHLLEESPEFHTVLRSSGSRSAFDVVAIGETKDPSLSSQGSKDALNKGNPQKVDSPEGPSVRSKRVVALPARRLDDHPCSLISMILRFLPTGSSPQ